MRYIPLYQGRSHGATIYVRLGYTWSHKAYQLKRPTLCTEYLTRNISLCWWICNWGVIRENTGSDQRLWEVISTDCTYYYIDKTWSINYLMQGLYVMKLCRLTQKIYWTGEIYINTFYIFSTSYIASNASYYESCAKSIHHFSLIPDNYRIIDGKLCKIYYKGNIVKINGPQVYQCICPFI